MKAIACVLVAALVSGCGTHAHINASANTSSSTTVSAGTRVTSGSAGLQVQGGSNSVSAALVAIFLLAGAIDFARGPRVEASSRALPEPFAPAPELAPGRSVSEQDCTQPVDFTLGNLRCK